MQTQAAENEKEQLVSVSNKGKKRKEKKVSRTPHLVKGSTAAVDLGARVKADSSLSPVEAPVPAIEILE